MDSEALELVIIAILIVLCFWLLVLLERTSERAEKASAERSFWEGLHIAKDQYATAIRGLLDETLSRNQELVDRMMREGFVEIPPLEPEGVGDASESGEKWPPLSPQDYRDSTGHWPKEETVGER